MPSFRTGRVTALISSRPGIQRVAVGESRAYALTGVVGPVAVGDEVVLNTTAVELGLGSGGWDVVHWNLSRTGWRGDGGGRVMKARYLSEQVDTGAAEEGGPGEAPVDLGGAPVVVAPLHSHLPVVAAAIAAARPGTRVGYVMDDTAALPYALSDVAAALRETGLLHVSVSAGQAFGGDIEAVNVASGLTLAVHAGADVVVVAPGPGVVGTGSTLGFGSIAGAAWLDWATALGGVAVASVRFSRADERDRHRGVSHHSRTVLRLVARQVVVPVPAGPLGEEVAAGLPDRSEIRVVPVDTADHRAVLDRHGLTVSTMGRTLDDDPEFGTVAAAAGTWAASAVTRHGR